MRDKLSGVLLIIVGASAAAADDLAEVVALAEQRDPRFLAAAASYRAAQESLPQARANLYLPTISVGTGAGYTWEDIDLENSSRFAVFGGGNFDYENYGYTLSVVQPIFHYDRHAQLKQAHSSVRQAALEFDAARQELMLRTAQRFFGVLEAEDDLALRRGDKEGKAAQLDRVTQQFEAGLLPNTDVQEARAAHDLALADEIRAIKVLDDAREALREISGTFHEELTPLRAQLPLAAPDPPDVEAWIQTAIDQNLSLAAAAAGVEVAAQEIRVQTSGHLPSIDVVGSHGTAVSGGRFGSIDADTSAIGVRMLVPLYEGGQTSSRVRQATYQHEAAIENLEATRRTVQRTTRDAYASVVSAISRLTALAQAVRSNEVALAATQSSFEAGTRTSVDVIAQQTTLLRAQTDNARARYEYVLSGLQLKQAAGTLSPQDIGIVSSWLEP